ncbi:hypothetical protein E4653_06795 [Corynebacterium diphtheriae subsp. lausannense]|nr:hypothetical protein E4653_06795 [Corynebacterium diphtheriae subsp. lausannense]
MISSPGVRAWHKILGSLALSVQNQEPTVQPNRNAIVDTICSTVELGETITRAAEHGDSYRHRSRAHQ